MARYWIVGAMSGIPSFNYPRFMEVQEDLRARGHDAHSPLDLDDEPTARAAMESPDGRMPPEGINGTHYYDFMLSSLREIMRWKWDAIVAIPASEDIPGWKESTGARIETFVARSRNIPILEYGEDDPLAPVDLGDLIEVHGVMS